MLVYAGFKSVLKINRQACVSSLHYNYVAVPAEKTSNNIVFVLSVILMMICQLIIQTLLL